MAFIYQAGDRFFVTEIKWEERELKAAGADRLLAKLPYPLNLIPESGYLTRGELFDKLTKIRDRSRRDLSATEQALGILYPQPREPITGIYDTIDPLEDELRELVGDPEDIAGCEPTEPLCAGDTEGLETLSDAMEEVLGPIDTDLPDEGSPIDLDELFPDPDRPYDDSRRD